MSADVRFTVCPVCMTVRRVNKDGTIRKHMVDTSVRLPRATIYGNAWCAGGGQPADDDGGANA